MTSTFYTYVSVWMGSKQVSDHSIRLVVTEAARATMEMNGSWDHQIQASGGYLFKMSTRDIFQTGKIYERKLHLAVRHEHGLAHLFIEEGDRLTICDCTADRLCLAMTRFLD